MDAIWPTWQLTLAILAPLAAGVLTLCLPRGLVLLRVLLTAAGPAAALALLGLYAYEHGLVAPPAVDWMPMFRLNLALNPDHLGMFFALLVSGIGLLIVLYARAYFGPDPHSLYRFYPSLLLFMTAMLGVALADNLMLMLLFWEMTSISSFLLIGWERDDPGAVKKAMQAFVVTGLGGLVLMAGLILMGTITGAWTFTELLALREAGDLPAGGTMVAAFLMIFVGAAAKSAQYPLHFWLPGAMAAPTPVSAYLHSATMVKAGVYLVGRLWPILAVLPGFALWPQLIVPLGAVTMVLGAFIALQKSDLKQIFAYTTVSQLGLLMCMYGLAAFEMPAQHAGGILGGAWAAAAGEAGTPGAAVEAYVRRPIWDVTQILNHALYKAPLFILAGAIGHIASRELPELRGFFWQGRTAKIMSLVLLLAAYALAAGPLTVSFSAKEMFFYQIHYAWKATHHPAFWLLAGAGVATGMFNVAIFIRIAATLLGRRQPAEGPHEADQGDHEADDPRHAYHESHVRHERRQQAAHAAGHAPPATHAHAEHHHETGLWPIFLWLPGLIIVAFQYLGGLWPGLYDTLFGWLEANPIYFHHFPMTWDVELGVPLVMSLIAIALGLALGFSNLLRGVVHDPHDGLYPLFYKASTQIVGPGAFRFVQGYHARYHIAAIALATVAAVAWACYASGVGFRWPAPQVMEPAGDLLPGYISIVLVCASAVLLTIVRHWTARVLILGTYGFTVTAVFYIYKAPDLALTQISIEIVSLILFLLVLSLLPEQALRSRQWVGRRVVVAVLLGLTMFYLTLMSNAVARPGIAAQWGQDPPYAHVGEFFLRNSYKGVDTMEVPVEKLQPGVVARSSDPQAASPHEVDIHDGGGGRNVVNVILVDFRGADTLGEVIVLGIAAMGVWSLVRRRKGERSPKERIASQDLRQQGGAPPSSTDGRGSVPAPPDTAAESAMRS